MLNSVPLRLNVRFSLFTTIIIGHLFKLLNRPWLDHILQNISCFTEILQVEAAKSH